MLLLQLAAIILLVKATNSLFINYFAYGSNLSPAKLAKRTRSDNYVPVRCILQDYKLVFNLGSKTRSYASVEPDKGSQVHGLVYSMSHDEFNLLMRS